MGSDRKHGCEGPKFVVLDGRFGFTRNQSLLVRLGLSLELANSLVDLTLEVLSTTLVVIGRRSSSSLSRSAQAGPTGNSGPS